MPEVTRNLQSTAGLWFAITYIYISKYICMYLQWISSPSLVQLTYPFTCWRAEMKILLLPNTLSLLAEHLCISRYSGWRQTKSKLLPEGDRKADREIKGRRGKTKELNEPLLPGLPEGGQAAGRKHGEHNSEKSKRITGNEWWPCRTEVITVDRDVIFYVCRDF